MLASDLRADFRWLMSGFLLTLCSGFGQTYYIAIFAGHLKSDLGISEGLFGSLYTVGTLTSAAILVWAGKFADHFPTRWLGASVLLGLALASLSMASVNSAWLLVLALFGLRFFGQGMMTHVAMTAMGRWFDQKRGRAVSIAALGFPASEAVLPIVAVEVIEAFGWRMAWTAAAVALVVVPLPLFLLLLKRERKPIPSTTTHKDLSDLPVHRQWTRGEVLRSPLFYALMPGVVGPAFVLTGLFFNQVGIVELKGWKLSWFAAGFPILAGVSVFAALIAGWLVDKFGARHLVPLFMIPPGIATLFLIYGTSPMIITLFMGLIGITMGGASTVQGALWAELYGTAHLGSIRALATAGMVFASALSPGLIGVLLDAGVPLTQLLMGMAILCFAVAVWMVSLMPKLNKLAESELPE